MITDFHCSSDIFESLVWNTELIPAVTASVTVTICLGKRGNVGEFDSYQGNVGGEGILSVKTVYC